MRERACSFGLSFDFLRAIDPSNLLGHGRAGACLPIFAVEQGNGSEGHSSPMARPASSVQVGFSAPLVNVSGIRVDSLKVVGDTPPPYKGVRPMMRSGSLEFRW